MAHAAFAKAHAAVFACGKRRNAALGTAPKDALDPNRRIIKNNSCLHPWNMRKQAIWLEIFLKTPASAARTAPAGREGWKFGTTG